MRVPKKMKLIKAKSIIWVVTVLVVLSISNSCNKETTFDCFKSTGSVERVERKVPFFHSIQMNDNVNVFLVKSDTCSLELESGKNLMNQIATNVTADSILIIENNNTCNWVRSYDKPVNVYLNFVELKNIEYRSVGDLSSSDTLRLDSLQLDIYEGAGEINLTLSTHICEVNLHYGTADVYLKGRSDVNVFYQLGAGKIDAGNLMTENVYLRNWSSNNMYVWATNFLSVEIKGLGNVYYRGKPGIDSSLLGEGELLPIQ